MARYTVADVAAHPVDAVKKATYTVADVAEESLPKARSTVASMLPDVALETAATPLEAALGVLPGTGTFLKNAKELPPEERKRMIEAVGPTVATVVIGALSAGLGALGRVGMAGLGAATGEATRQIQDAALNSKVEPSVGDAAAKILAADLGGMSAAGIAEATAAIPNVGKPLYDFVANVRRGTAQAGSELPAGAAKGLAKKYTLEAVQGYGQRVADLLKQAKQTAGQKISSEIAAVERAPTARFGEGQSISVPQIETELEKLKAGLHIGEAIEGTDPLTAKAVNDLGAQLKAYKESTGNFYMPLSDAKRLLDRAREMVEFNPATPGSSAAQSKRISPFTEWLRSRLAPEGTPLDAAMSENANVFEAERALKKGLGISGGEKIDLAKIEAIEQGLPKLLREGPVKRSAEEAAVSRLGGDTSLLDEGKTLAVAKELASPPETAAGGGGVSGAAAQMLRGFTQAPARLAFRPAVAGFRLATLAPEEKVSLAQAIIGALRGIYEGARK